MQDPIDEAAHYQAQLNDEAVAMHATRSRLAQRVVDGRVYCLDCNQPIEAQRLRAYKEAALCVKCAYKREG